MRVVVGVADLAVANNTSVGNALLGVGFTHYFMPANAFVGVTLGTGTFSIINGNGNGNGSTNNGFGYILRAGKEWWVGRKMGLGVVGGVSHLSASDKADPAYPSYTATFTTTAVFLGFSATFN